jgi:DNA-binding transcriptional regulator YiaG
MDAIAELRALPPGLSDADRTWVMENAATSLAEIEKTILRIVAIRASRNLSTAAERLGMSVASLSTWISRRKLPPMLPAT